MRAPPSDNGALHITEMALLDTASARREGRAGCNVSKRGGLGGATRGITMVAMALDGFDHPTWLRHRTITFAYVTLPQQLCIVQPK